MSRTAAKQGFLGLVDSDSDDDLGASFTADDDKPKTTAKAKSAAGSKKPDPIPAAAKKGKGRPAANKVTKPRANNTTRRASGKLVAAVEHATERQALADKPRNQTVAAPKRGRKAAAAKPAPEEEEEEVEEEEEEVEEEEEAEDPVAASAAPKTKTTRGRPKAAAAPAQKKNAAEAPPPPASAPAKRGRKPAATRKAAVVEEPKSPEIPETQPQELMDVDVEDPTAMEADEEQDASHLSQEPTAETLPPLLSSPTKGGRKAATGEVDDTDPSLRRRLGEMTKKHDALSRKYNDLHEVGIKEAEKTFDRFKKQSDERAKSASDLIAKLKAELAAQKELAKEGKSHKSKLDAKESEAAALESQVAALETSLDEARKEMKSLSAKLAASRTMEVVPNAAKVPGSALKAGAGASSRSLVNAEAVQIAQAAQMKEDLYGDLTGLIVRGIKRNEDEDVYDCIQTGRNGTLHFKLSIGNGLSGENYDEAQFMYMPQLDPSRDRALIETLPDYLVEEISFPRPHAAKFYARVMKSLTERVD